MYIENSSNNNGSCVSFLNEWEYVAWERKRE